MKYVAYHRTSTKDQHLDRGIAELTKYCADNVLFRILSGPKPCHIQAN